MNTSTGERFCQSCGMPMGQTDELYGTESDGSKSRDYCKYCYEKGAFTFTGAMEEMIEICVPGMTAGNPGMSTEKARQMMKQFFPSLKRWKDQSGAKLVHFEIIRIPPLRVIGKEIRVSMKGLMEGNNPLMDFWGKCMTDGTFESLQKLPGLYSHDYVGYMGDWQNGETFVNVCGMLYTDSAAPLPDGFTAWDIEAATVAVGWIQGPSVDIICSSEHVLTAAALKEKGYNSENALWSMEVYNEQRFSKPDAAGNILVDYWVPAAPVGAL